MEEINFYVGLTERLNRGAVKGIVWLEIIRGSHKCLSRQFGTSVPDWAIFYTLGYFLKLLAINNLPKSPTFLCKF